MKENDLLDHEEFEFYKEIQLKKEIDLMGKFMVHGKTVFYSKNSLFFMDETSDYRKALVWIIEWK